MTEIPEHLLARSKARRQAIGQDEGGAPADAAASTAVEKAAPAAEAPAGPAAASGLAPAKAPAAPAPPPEKPKRPEVLAAESRKKAPWWAVAALVALPVWAFMYAFTLEPPSQESAALSAGRAIYSSAGCAGCHGATGGGGVGPAFAEGAIVETFADFNDHVEWVATGSAAWPESTYGDTEKPVLGFNGNEMPAFGSSLSEEELLEVVRYEREVLGGHGCEPELAEATGEECAPGTEAEAASG
jgi:mono/diheme cytochrome c family protein